jgi:hypothetical protein
VAGAIKSFEVDIPGCPDASKNIREIAIDELNIDIRETTTGLDVEYRTYSPGAAHWGQAKFSSALAVGSPGEFKAWFDEAAAIPPGGDPGPALRDIPITLLAEDGTAGRAYNLFDCFPTKLTPLASDACSGEQREEVTVACNHIEILAAGPDPAAAEAAVSDKFAQVRGFKVDITGAGGKEVDTAWESVSGGELIIELTETTVGGDTFQTTSPGHKSVGEITLRGAMTDKRMALSQWINDTTSGREWRRDLTITELLSVDGSVKPGKAYEYKDVFPVGYVFPRLSVTNTTGNVMEEVRLKPIRVELK